MRAYHDLGGLEGGTLDLSEHDYTLWEKRVHALFSLLGERELMTADELREGIETLGAAEYDRLGYYERWIESITRGLMRRGVLTSDELGRKLQEIDARETDAG